MRYQGLPDRGLLVNGPHVPVQIANISHIALLDTGARHSYIDEDLLLALGLPTVQDLVGDNRLRLLMVRSGDMSWEHRNRCAGIL